MADCLGPLASRKLQCKNIVAGYKAAYIIGFDPEVITFNTTGSSVTTISGMTVDTAFKFELKATTNTLTSEGASSRDNSTTVYTQTAVLNLGGLSSDDTNQLKYLAAGRTWLVVQTHMNEYLLLGKNEGMDVTTLSFQVGGAKTDFQGAVVTFEGMEAEPWFHLSPAAITTLLANTADFE